MVLNDEKQQMENLSKKYDNLYVRYSTISEIIKSVAWIGLILCAVNVHLQYLLSSTLSAHFRWILNGVCIGLLVLVILLYIIKVRFIDVKCSEYAWYSNVVYGTSVRQMEYIENCDEETEC